MLAAWASIGIEALAGLRPIEKHLSWFALGAQYSARARKP